MKNIKILLRTVAALCVFTLLAVGIIRTDLSAVFEKAACASVMSVIPEGFIMPYSESIKLPENITDVTVNNIPDDLEEPPSISVSVDETIIGNIIKKTLSPYSANTSQSGVYLNNNTNAAVNIKKELEKPLDFSVAKNAEPQILIYHTHATEGFMANESDYYTQSDEPRTTDTTKNIVAVGAVIAEQLKAAGYGVVHDVSLHDYPGYSGSYSRSAETITATLKKYPSIKIAIDVHRDSITSGESDKVAPVVTVEGKEAAQVMLVMGSETGGIEDYPNWRENLRLALKLQYVFEKNYPQLARSILLRSKKYNQDMLSGAILIEMGSDANTLEQALYSGELVGKSLVALLDSQL